MKKILFVILLFLPVTIFGCGYSTKSSLPANLRTIHVEPFKNTISYTAEAQRSVYFPLMEVKIRNAVNNRFLVDGALKIREAETSDLVLRGELKNYERTVLRYTDNDDAQEYRATVTVSLEMWNSTKGEVMWSESSFSGESTYFVTGPQAKSEETAINEAIVDLARRIVERTIEDW